MIAIFSGISLAEDALACLPASCDPQLLPPIARGDLGSAFDRGARIFGIVDGVFDQTRAVAPSEILEILRVGGRVLGSSSMGAMRAAELDGHGMIGVGRIYELVRRAPAFRDDWLGHLFDPFTNQLVTLPFIEVVGAIGAALSWDLPALDEVVRRLEAAREVRFDELTPAVSEELVAALPAALRRPVGRRLAQIWLEPRRSLKCRDARALVERIDGLVRDVATDNARLRSLGA